MSFAPIHERRLARIRTAMVEAGVNALLLLRPEHVYYFSGFWAAAPIRLLCLLLPAADPPCLIVPPLEEAYARSASVIADIRIYPEFTLDRPAADPADTIKGVFAEKGLERARIGIEEDAVPVSVARMLAAALPGVAFENSSPLLTRLRLVKDAEEIEAVRKAAAVADVGAAALFSAVQPGVSELDLAIKAAYAGAMASEFLISPYNSGVPVVASGPRSAFPHGRASMNRVAAGDFLVVDLCAIAVHRGYHAGFTRTVAVRMDTSRHQEVYEVVAEAQAAACDAVRPGTSAEAVDEAARGVIVRSGYGEYLLHRTGTGVGLDVAEAPYLRLGDQTVLQLGMTLSVEPGVYIPGWGGVRIEDTVLVTQTGQRALDKDTAHASSALRRGATVNH